MTFRDSLNYRKITDRPVDEKKDEKKEAQNGEREEEEGMEDSEKTEDKKETCTVQNDDELLARGMQLWW